MLRLRLYFYNIIDITVIEHRLHLVHACKVTTKDGEDIKKIVLGKKTKEMYSAEFEVFSSSFPRSWSVSLGSVMDILSHGSRAIRLFLDLLIAGANN